MIILGIQKIRHLFDDLCIYQIFPARKHLKAPNHYNTEKELGAFKTFVRLNAKLPGVNVP